MIWFQQHKADFKDLTTMKNMFLARYNPSGKTKREQLQSWNNLSFDPQKTDLVRILGDMLQQDEHTKMEKFIETMPTIIQTHLIIVPKRLLRRPRTWNISSDNVTHWLLPHQLHKVQEQFLAYILI